MSGCIGIDLDEVIVGDWLGVVDARGNRARGPVLRAGNELVVGAFGAELLVAKRGPQTGRMRTQPTLRVTEHQPQLLTGGPE